MHITLLLSQFLHRAVKFTSKLFGRALSRRIKATVLYATETGRSEQYAKQLVELLGHAFNAQVSEHRSMVPRLWIYPFFRAGCWFWEKVFTDGALLGVDLRGNNVVRGWDWTTYVWRWMSVLLRYHSITCRCAFTAPRDGSGSEIGNENNVPDMASNPPHKSKGKGENMQIKFGKPQVVTYSLVRLDNLVCHAFWWVSGTKIWCTLIEILGFVVPANWKLTVSNLFKIFQVLSIYFSKFIFGKFSITRFFENHPGKLKTD